MTLRPPRGHRRRTPANALDYEIAQEQASALGRLGRALEAALAALVEYESANPGGGAGRAELLQAASEALWCFIVQREACGLRNSRQIFRQYRVPSEVHARMGTFGRR